MQCYSKAVIAKRIELREKAIEHMGNKCAHCGGVFPYPAYDFCHKEEFKTLDQTKRISNMCRASKPWKEIEEELKKCILICSNCNRVRTYNNKNKEVTIVSE